MAEVPMTSLHLRDAFLVTLAALAPSDMHAASDLGRSQFVRQAIEDTCFETRTNRNRAVDELAIPHSMWTDFLEWHNLGWGLFGDPLQVGDEMVPTIYFAKFICPVLSAINALRPQPQQHFVVSLREHIVVDQQRPRIHVTGESDYVVMCGDAPCCVVEFTRYEEGDDAGFNQGINKAIVSAAAIGRQHHQNHVLAIVTDLCRWRFLRVSRTGFWQSREYLLQYSNGRPDEDSLRSTLERVLGFLHHEWPSV